MKKFLFLALALSACGNNEITCLFEAEGICFVESNSSPEIVSDLAYWVTYTASVEARPDLFAGIQDKMEAVNAKMYIQPDRPYCNGSPAEGCTVRGTIMYVYHEGDDQDCLAYSAFAHEMLHVMVDTINLPDNGDMHGHDGIWGAVPGLSWEEKSVEHKISSHLRSFCEHYGYH